MDDKVMAVWGKYNVSPHLCTVMSIESEGFQGALGKGLKQERAFDACAKYGSVFCGSVFCIQYHLSYVLGISAEK